MGFKSHLGVLKTIGSIDSAKYDDFNKAIDKGVYAYNKNYFLSQNAPADAGVLIVTGEAGYVGGKNFLSQLFVSENNFIYSRIRSAGVWSNWISPNGEFHTDTLTITANHGNNIYVDNSQNGGMLCIANVTTGDVKIIGIPLSKTFTNEEMGDIIVRRFNSNENVVIFNNSATDIGIRYIFLNL